MPAHAIMSVPLMDGMGDWLMAVRESGTIQERREADAR